ncbi:hypothetical protein L210DRAFT_3642725 [Boletus edulis BED1]|uniref:Uncharacterized protein n=1 Tax=Boletus edulis BED1 TaxID=1328754 RepID=A0AAD4GGZ7_BOLED|nr:hypothetical protein L210DRAFT_3642725 [Boletus edulis BED1]
MPMLKKRKMDGIDAKSTHKACSGSSVDKVKEESEDESRNFSVHVQAYRTVVEKKPGRNGKTSSTTTFMSKPGFKFNTNFSFAKFEMKIASVLSCSFAALPVAQLEWKFEGQPQSAPHKNIAKESGYKILVDVIKAKRPTDKVIVLLYTTQPLKEISNHNEQQATKDCSAFILAHFIAYIHELDYNNM